MDFTRQFSWLWYISIFITSKGTLSCDIFHFVHYYQSFFEKRMTSKASKEDKYQSSVCVYLNPPVCWCSLGWTETKESLISSRMVRSQHRIVVVPPRYSATDRRVSVSGHNIGWMTWRKIGGNRGLFWISITTIWLILSCKLQNKMRALARKYFWKYQNEEKIFSPREQRREYVFVTEGGFTECHNFSYSSTSI